MFIVPARTIEELREWMTSLGNSHQITDEVLGWLNCQFNAKLILEQNNQQALAVLLHDGCKSFSTKESLQDTMNYEHEDEEKVTLHLLSLHESAAILLRKSPVAKQIRKQMDDLVWWDDH